MRLIIGVVVIRLRHRRLHRPGRPPRRAGAAVRSADHSGCAGGAFVIGNTGPVLKQTGSVFGILFKGRATTRRPIYRTRAAVQPVQAGSVQGILALEAHIENPHESAIFNNFRPFMKDHHAVEFMCDYPHGDAWHAQPA